MSEPVTGASGPKKRFWRWTPARGALIIALALVPVLWLLWDRCGVSGCPSVAQLVANQPGGESVLLDAAGRQFADLSPIGGEVVDLDSLPEYIPNAFIALEDRRFLEHHGVDARRVVGAMLANIKARRVSQGFSTLTMQLTRDVWPDRVPGGRRTLARRVLDIRVAREIERKYSKREILELYLNHSYFGDGAFGIDAAARDYFRKPAQRLTLAEAALLAAVPGSPNTYNPRRYPERTEARRALVLELMTRQGLIGRQEAAQAKAATVQVQRDPAPRRQEAAAAPYFVEAVRRVLESHFGADLYATPLRIHTTLDQRAQRAAEAELQQQLSSIEQGAHGPFRGPQYGAGPDVADETSYLQGAVVVMRADSGAVVALVGGRDYAQSRFNRATRARRQLGSVFKPFVYAAAIEAGYPPSQLISDSTLRLQLPGGGVWEPRNADDDHDSFVSLRTALVESKNLPTIRLAQEVGLGEVARTARRAGIPGELPELPAMAVGSAAATPLELAAAYTPFATLGKAVAPQFVTRVENSEGKVIWRTKVQLRSVLDGGTAYVVTDMLRDALDSGTGTPARRAGYRGVGAGKTGTASAGADLWFAGYTPEYVAAVWIGFDRPAEVVPGASAGQLASPLWGRLMSELYAGRKPARPWSRPHDVLERQIDPSTGFLLIEGCQPERGYAADELFIKGTEPPAQCPRGRPAPGVATIFDEFGNWLERLQYRAGAWLASHVGTEKPQAPQADQRYLGAPRLPRAIEVPHVDPDSVVVVPADTIAVPSPADSLPPPDTSALDTIPGHTPAMSTAAVSPDTSRRLR